MALDIFGNLWAATVSSGGTDAPASGTQQSWTATPTVGAIPSASSSATPPTQFSVVEDDQARQTEIIRVINVSGSGPYTLTVIRGDEGTTPVAHPAGFQIVQTLTKRLLSKLAVTGGIYLEAIIKAGAAAVGTNLLPPGLRVPADCQLANVFVWCGTAPTGSALTVVVKRTTTGGTTTTVATVNVAAGATTGTAAVDVALLEGEILTFDITAVGSTVAGADVAAQIEAF